MRTTPPLPENPTTRCYRCGRDACPPYNPYEDIVICDWCEDDMRHAT